MTLATMPEMLTPAQAARKLQVSGEYVRELANSGKLPCTRTPLGRLFRVEDIERFEAERTARLEAK
jgi:excisionase family DNA binding protein